MVYATAGRRPTAKFPIFGRQWHNLSRRNADLDTASGKDRQKYRREYEGKDGKVTWLKPKHRRIDGYVDLAALLGRVNWAVAYAATSVPSPEARQMQLRIGSDDDVKAWLNGELVLSRNADRAALPDQDVAPVTLRKGQNQLLLKVCNRLYSWGFYARIVEPNVPRNRPDWD